MFIQVSQTATVGPPRYLSQADVTPDCFVLFSVRFICVQDWSSDGVDRKDSRPLSRFNLEPFKCLMSSSMPSLLRKEQQEQQQQRQKQTQQQYPSLWLQGHVTIQTSDLTISPFQYLIPWALPTASVGTRAMPQSLTKVHHLGRGQHACWTLRATSVWFLVISDAPKCSCPPIN